MNSSSELSILDSKLEAESPSKMHRNNICFIEAYEVIEKHLQRKIPLKTVLEGFNSSYSLSVSPARFRQLLEEERKRRQDIGADAETPDEDEVEVA